MALWHGWPLVGHEVRAFYLQIWFQEDFRNFWDECPWEEDLRYAREVSTATECDDVGIGYAAYGLCLCMQFLCIASFLCIGLVLGYACCYWMVRQR